MDLEDEVIFCVHSDRGTWRKENRYDQSFVSAVYRCISMFLDAEQSVYNFICSFAVASSPPPTPQGTGYPLWATAAANEKIWIEIHFWSRWWNTFLNTLPTQRTWEHGFSWLFFRLEDTNLWRQNPGPCWRKGKEKLANVAKWSLNNSTVKSSHCVRMFRTENSPGKASLGWCAVLFCFVLFSWLLILKSCSACFVAAKS